MIFRFYKEDSLWYIDIPDYQGLKQDLELVAGANTWLDILSDNGDEIFLNISLEPLKNCITKIEEDETGAYYVAGEDHVMWLCPVVTHLFNKYPDVIYYEETRTD